MDSSYHFMSVKSAILESPNKSDSIMNAMNVPSELELTLVSHCGASRSVTISSYEPVRSLIAHFGISPPARSHWLFVANGVPLQPDFSFARQGVTTGAEVRVLFQRAARITAIGRSRRLGSVHQEKLRLADLSFLPFETTHARHDLAILMGKARKAECGRVDEGHTNIEKATLMSDAPLPTLWGEIAPGCPRPRAEKSA
jgi:hypothetical protein